EDLVEVAPLEQLHHDERAAVGRDSVVEHLDDMRAPELRGRRRLPREPRDGVSVRRELVAHDLHDDLAAQAEVLRYPDAAHPAAAERAAQADLRRDKGAGCELHGARLSRAPERRVENGRPGRLTHSSERALLKTNAPLRVRRSRSRLAAVP